MHGPASSGWLLVALCAATGAYCLLRMHSSDETQRLAAGDEALMGFGMAAMAVPGSAFTPPAWVWPVYAVVFGGAALRALWVARTGPHHLHHLVGAAAMVYMAAVMTASPTATGHAHGGSGVPLLTGGLLVYFTAYVLVSGVRLLPVAGVAGGAAARSALAWGDRPELARACRLSMGIGMLAMLLTI
ncbi:DUF5134 domain-containing protein [Streptomyces phaeoluteigriseus]|uniref:DUF5134 domain-containing protein n=1 Tax=Streptomyces phaeoluteigriseus TaxID=114686 RepID=A0ABY4ZMW9_9ACTN|nr:DUF5134 domain-containing protein [Streptomyces phaeoluteigriseus]USQ89688.1 DUF5134 domain-containing protein [Streptomyces phaeoluteigriseus]